MAERVTAGDSAAVRRAAHALKSSALSLQASSLAGLAGELEARARAGQLGDAGSLVEAIRGEFAAVRQRFEVLG
jgi:HPt (histidine-containing phosphotransfer) domain-containing protein